MKGLNVSCGTTNKTIDGQMQRCGEVEITSRKITVWSKFCLEYIATTCQEKCPFFN